MPIGAGFHVEPEDLSKAGDNATEIGDRMFLNSGDLLAQASNASGGLDGFALGGELSGCAQAWDEQLASVARKTQAAGERLLSAQATGRRAEEIRADGWTC